MVGKDIGIVEGVMGLYDGRSPGNEEGSTAELAKLLAAPVVLVVDAAKAARSLAAMVLGYWNFDPALHLAGVILNNIGSEEHFRLCQEAIEKSTSIPVLGYMPRRDEFELPERHLGLIPTEEGVVGQRFFDRLIAQAEATIDIQRLFALAEEAVPPVVSPTLFPSRLVSSPVRIAVARDKAFSFYYQDSLDLLEAWGGELIFFSPLEDEALPSGISGIYLGGGFPELYAAELAENTSMRRSVKRAVESGMPVYAECGGLMYLGRFIRDFQSREYPMVGAIPLFSRLDNPRLSLGYRTVQALRHGPLLRRGEVVRGHEFHWSTPEGGSGERSAYQILEEGRREGFQKGKLLASYIHLHLGSLPSMASRFVQQCRRYQKGGYK
jgi:cobyrinic acid a,c-diamide synthase